MGLNALRVLTLESRRSEIVEKLILEQQGECFNAPSVRERPLETNPQAMQFANELIAGRYDMVIFTTGVGTRYLMEALTAGGGPVDAFVEGLRRVQVVSRRPKPAAVLNEMGIPV